MPGSRRLDLPTVQGPDHEERMERTRVREKTRARGVCAPQTRKRKIVPRRPDVLICSSGCHSSANSHRGPPRARRPPRLGTP